MSQIAFKDYAASVEHVARLVEHEDYETALRELADILRLDISDTDRAMMCLNMATVYGKLSRHEDALAWLDQGVTYERRAGGTFVTEQRALYLAEQGRYREGLVRYQELLCHPGLTEGDRQRIGLNLDLLLKRIT